MLGVDHREPGGKWGTEAHGSQYCEYCVVYGPDSLHVYLQIQTTFVDFDPDTLLSDTRYQTLKLSQQHNLINQKDIFQIIWNLPRLYGQLKGTQVEK